MHYPITQKIGTQQDAVKAHCDTKFGCNTINGKINLKTIIHENNTNNIMLSRLQDKLLMVRS